MQETKKHRRVAVAEIKASPQQGLYLTKAEARKCGICTAVVFSILTVFAVFQRKG